MDLIKMKKKFSTDTGSEKYMTPLPTDFVEYVPWACYQLQTRHSVLVKKKYQELDLPVLVSNIRRASSRYGPRKYDGSKELDSVTGNYYLGLKQTEAIEVIAIYDYADQLIHLKFEDRCNDLTVLIKVVSLIVRFHPSLSSLTYKGYITEPVWKEIQNLIAVSNITDVCLDGSDLQSENFQDVLRCSRLRSFSLARCGIHDDCVKCMMFLLSSKEDVSTTLRILNLSSNFIGDQGAKHIGNMLRFNRTLSFLNVAANYVSDDGAEGILNAFIDFKLTENELYEVKRKRMEFLRKREQLIQTTIAQLQNQKEYLYSHPKRKSVKKQSKIILPHELKFQTRTKAENFVREIMGDFADPIVKLEKGTGYGFGNDSLVYLNLSYNNLSYLSVKKVLKVLEFQNKQTTKKGLINISIEGNNIPVCAELERISDILQIKLNEIKEIDLKNRRVKIQSSKSKTRVT